MTTPVLHGPLLIGPARDLILNYLKDNINNEIKNPDYQRDDGINIEPISSQAFYISKLFLISMQPPSVYVLKNGKMKMDYTDAPNWLRARDPFKVILSCEDVGADILEQKCETYGQILFKLLDQQDLETTDGLLKIHTVIEALDFGEEMARNSGETGEIYRRDVILELTALHFEARTTSS